MSLQQTLASLSPGEAKELLDLLEKHQANATKVAAKADFLTFAREVWPDFIAGEHHRLMADAFNDVISGKLKRLIVNMPPRHCLEVSTPVLTTNGWRTISELAVGDLVYGPDGRPTRVTGKSEVYRNRKLWRASTDDGANVLCDDGHLWDVSLCRKRRGAFTTHRTDWLAARVSIRRPMLPSQAPVQHGHKDLPIDPYTFGVWLGDGSSSHATVTMADDDAVHVRQRIESSGLVTADRRTRYTFGVGSILTKLRELGVLRNKHIPAEYLMASVSQRLSLLDGLMDTDGNVSAERQCFLATSSPVLMSQYRELLWSLGIKNGLATSRAIFNGRDYGEAYRIGFYAVGVGSLPRKRDRATGYVKKTGRYLSFERAGAGDVQCISVDREDGLFLAGHGLIVTHNTKSEFSSYLLPAFFLGHYPKKKVIQASHTSELSVGFGRKVRNLVDSEVYQNLFHTKLQADSKAAGRWNTDKGGEYFAIGVGGAVTGKGADCLIIDDPHSEQDAMAGIYSQGVYERVWEWYNTGPRQRLQPGGAIVVVATRWAKADLTGRLLEQAKKNGDLDEWRVIQFPAIMPSGNPLWPEFWPLKELEKLKKELPNSRWMAQYQQSPTSEEGAIIKRDNWQTWTKNRAPQCFCIISSWDTAFTKNSRSDYSACTTWGVFQHPDNGKPSVILLDAFKGRMEFPELKMRAKAHHQQWQPDIMLIEGRAAGQPLIYELRAMGIPVQEYTPGPGEDKVVRANAVSDLFASGMVFCPETAWADEVIEECVEFPNGAHDDYVDTVTQALLRIRKGGLVNSIRDFDDEDDPKPHRASAYY